MKTKYAYPAIFEKEENGYFVKFPDIKPCYTEGATLEECRLMLEDAAREMAIAYRENGLCLPEPSEAIDRVLVET